MESYYEGIYIFCFKALFLLKRRNMVAV